MAPRRTNGVVKRKLDAVEEIEQQGREQKQKIRHRSQIDLSQEPTSAQSKISGSDESVRKEPKSSSVAAKVKQHPDLPPGAAKAQLGVDDEAVTDLDDDPPSDEKKIEAMEISAPKFFPSDKNDKSWTDPAHLGVYLTGLENAFAGCTDPYHFEQLINLGGCVGGLGTEIAVVAAQSKDLAESAAEVKGIMVEEKTVGRVYVVGAVHGPTVPALIDPVLLALPERANVDLLHQTAAAAYEAKKGTVVETAAQGLAAKEIEEREIVGFAGQRLTVEEPPASIEAGWGSDGLARTQTAIGSDFEEGEGDDEYDPVKAFTTVLDDE